MPVTVMPVAKEIPASYDNPHGAINEGERVVSIGDCTMGLMVTTEHKGERCTYYGVANTGLKVGHIVNGKIKAVAMRVQPRAWSVFDGQDDD